MSATEDRSERSVYEIGYLLLPSIAEEALTDSVAKINKTIEEAGAEKISGEEPFMHPLAYQMKKVVGARKYIVDEAYLGWVKFELEPEKINEVKLAMEKLEEVLRFLLIKAPREDHFTFEKARQAKEDEKKAEEETPEAETASKPEPVVE